MQVKAEVTVIGSGVWGPFEDGRSIPYVVLVDDDSDTVKASLGEGVSPPERLSRGVVTLRYRINDRGNPSWRLDSFEQVRTPSKAAA